VDQDQGRPDQMWARGTPTSPVAAQRSSGSLRLITVEGADSADEDGAEAESAAVMVGGGNFGTSACTREDFVLMQVRMNHTIDRAEARLERSPRSDDSAFEAMFEEQVDTLCNEFEHLKVLLFDAHNSGLDGSARVVQDSLRLKNSICRMLTELDDRESGSAVSPPARTTSMWVSPDSPIRGRDAAGNRGSLGRRGSLSPCGDLDHFMLPGVASSFN